MSAKDQQQERRGSGSTLNLAPTSHGESQAGLDTDVEQQEQQAVQQTLAPPTPSWDSESDLANPLNSPEAKKNVIPAIMCICCLCVTCASSVISTAFEGIERDLGVFEEIAILTLSLFVLGLAIVPLFVAPFSELYGRFPIYLYSLGFFFLLGFPVAFANHISILCIFRFLTGLAGASFLNVAGGTISDMWLPKDMYIPFAYYSASAFLGPVLG